MKYAFDSDDVLENPNEREYLEKIKHAIVERDELQLSILLHKYAGINLNAVVPYMGSYHTLLIISCMVKSSSCFDALIQAGANPEAVNINGATPLHFACVEEGNFELISTCLDYGINVNERDFDGWTPLHMTITNDCVNNMIYLLEKGADPYAKVYSSGSVATTIAIEYHSSKVLRKLLEIGVYNDVEEMYWVAERAESEISKQVLVDFFESVKTSA